MTPSRPSALLSHALVAALLAGCSSTGEQDPDPATIRQAVRHGRFEEGVRMAEDHRRAHPDDPLAEEIHRLASVAYLLDKGRLATFEERDEEALDWFERAQEIAPGSELVAEWVDKTRHKLETIWVHKGHEAYAKGNLPDAMEAYDRALSYVPDSESALKAFGEVTLLTNYRNGLGDTYYEEGVRSLAEYWLERAKRSFNVSNKYQPENERARSRAAEVNAQLADQRVAVAHQLESEGFFFGALNEYRLAQRLDDQNVAAREGETRVESEAQAAQFLRQAEMKIFRKEYDAALALLDQGEPLTEVQDEAFEEARREALEARMSDLYQRALNLEHDQRYEDASAVYAEILDEVDFFEDARTRKSTLDGYIEMAAGYYGQYEAEEDPEKQLEYLRAIAGFWPEYRDVKARIAALEG